MTTARIIQLTAETRVVTNLDLNGANAPSISSTQKNTGGFSYLLPSQPSAMGYAIPSPVSAYRVGYWIRHNGLPNNSQGYLYLAASSKVQFEGQNIGIRINGVSSLLEVIRPVSGTTDSYEVLYSVATPASLVTISTWTHIGVVHKIDSTTGFLKLYINGILVVDYTGDTRPYGQGGGVGLGTYGSTASFIWIAGGYGISSNFVVPTYIDDFYIDSYVGESAAPVSAKTFDVQTTPTAGSNAGWTPLSSTNVSNIDENPNDGDTTYNKATVTAVKDSFGFSNITVPIDHVIVAMIPMVFVKRLDAGPDVQVRLLCLDTATYEYGSDQIPSLDYSIPLWERFLLQPDGSSWTESKANSVEFGYESRGTFS